MRYSGRLHPVFDSTRLRPLSQDFADDIAMDIGKAALEAVMKEGEAFMVEAEEVEHGGVEVMEGMDVLGCLEAEFVGGAMADTGLDAGTG